VTTTPAITVFVPTLNGGPMFRRTLEHIRQQQSDRPFEILVIDSGSTDGTASFLRAQDLRLIEIERRDFNHGRIRAMAIEQARGDVVVLTVQDAQPADRLWLQRLLDGFDDPAVAGVYSRQIPRPAASPFTRLRLERWLAGEAGPRVQHIPDWAAFEALHPLEKLRTIGFDNVSSAVRRRIARDVPFRDCEFGEDLDWSLRVLKAGYRIVYQPLSTVIHSHEWSLRREFQRVYLDHRHLHRLLGVRTVPTLRAAAAQSVGGILQVCRLIGADRTLSTTERLKWWSLAGPHIVSQTLAQYLGARSSAA
jgi:rhamnosyltransferase